MTRLMLTDAKAAVLGASVVAGIVGYISLATRCQPQKPQPANVEAAAE